MAEEPQEKNVHAAALSALGASKGGRARADKLSPERRTEIATKAAAARWKGSGAPIEAAYSGVVTIGDTELDCAVLPGGRRVISEAAVMRALGRGYSGYYSQRDAAAADGSAVLPRYVAPMALKDFISDDLRDLLLKPIPYVHPGSRIIAKGLEAEALPKICRVWLDARQAQKLNKAQLRTAQKAEILTAGLAEVGIVGLVDEATGYQEVRDRRALQEILDRFLRKELAAWAKTFPDQFYREIFRLRKWTWKGMGINRPQAVANYTKDIVYMRLAPGILEELEKRNPKDERGRRPGAHHQFLTEDVGHPALAQHLHAVIALMRVSTEWDGFKRMLDRAFPKRGDTLNIDFDRA